MKLRTLKTSLQSLPNRVAAAQTLSDQRMAGRKLQTRRLRMWTHVGGCCAGCGRLTEWPGGFELDHKVRLEDGGPDVDENCQVLCVYMDAVGQKQGCHEAKTKAEVSRKPWHV